MKILLTGATGFIGRKLAVELFKKDHELVLLSRNAEKASASVEVPCLSFAGDLNDGKIPPEALAGIEGVIHLAGEPIADRRWNAEQKKKIRESRSVGTKNLIDALAKAGLGKNLKFFISASAIGYYGSRGDEMLAESSSAGKDFLAEVCREWEAAANQAQTQLGCRAVQVRIGIVLGRDGGALAKLLPIFKSGVGGKVASGNQWMSWIHVQDLVSLFVFLTEPGSAKVSGPINGVAPKPVQNAEFTRSLAQALHRPAILPVPAVALKLAYGEMADVVLNSQRVSSLAEGKGFKFKFPALPEALKEICDNAYDRELIGYQFINKPVGEVFSFFSAAENLEEITPAWLHFEVEGMSTPEIREKTLIEYKLRVHGIPMHWQTRIEQWKPNESFIDHQLRGPYSKWIHTHTFDSVQNGRGTLIKDHVVYRLPVGVLGDSLMGWKIRRDVEEIFRFRREKISQKL